MDDTYTQDYRSHQEEAALAPSLYIALPLRPSDFLTLLLQRKNDFQPFLSVFSLPLVCSLSSVCQASRHHEWRDSLHTKAQTVPVSG